MLKSTNEDKQPISKAKIIGIITSLFVLIMGCFFGVENINIDDNNTSKSGTVATGVNVTMEYKRSKEYTLEEAKLAFGCDIKILKIEKSKGTEYDKPKTNMEYIIVTMNIKNISNKVISYNPYHFKIQNSLGSITSPAATIINIKDALNSGELIPNGLIEGTVAFEAPINDKLVMYYQPNMFIDDVVKIPFN